VPEPLQADDLPLGLFLQPAAPRDIIARMLRNLKELHRSNEDWQRLIAVLDRMVVCCPTDWQELRGSGLAHAASGQHALALQDLEAYLAHAGDAADALRWRNRSANCEKLAKTARSAHLQALSAIQMIAIRRWVP
jgi:regulator of sirC expression with transglutaminase-like and TPR domain